MRRTAMVLVTMVLALTVCTASAECWWNDYPLVHTTYDAQWDADARKDLQRLEHVWYDPADGQTPVKQAAAYGDRIAVWFAVSSSDPGYISVYRPSGEFVESYLIEFDRANGYDALCMYEGSVLVYTSRNNAVYRLCGEELTLYHVPGADIERLRAVQPVDSGSVSIAAVDGCRVDIRMPDGRLRTIVDHNDVFERMYPKRSFWQANAPALAVVGFWAAALCVMLRRQLKRLPADKKPSRARLVAAVVAVAAYVTGSGFSTAYVMGGAAGWRTLAQILEGLATAVLLLCYVRPCAEQQKSQEGTQ